MSQKNQNTLFQTQLEGCETTEIIEQKDQQAYLALGMNDLCSGQYTAAMNHFMTALKIDPNCQTTQNCIKCAQDVIRSNQYINLALEYLKFTDQDPDKYSDVLRCLTEALQISTFFKSQINTAIADTINKKRKKRLYKIQKIEKGRY